LSVRDFTYIPNYAIHENYVYFSLAVAPFGENGLFVTSLDNDDSPIKLLSFEDIHGGNRYRGTFRGLSSLEISSDGRWALLTVHDNRVHMMDIPLIDMDELPQGDPLNAISRVTGWPWSSHHNVVLFDLQSNTMIDPFVQEGIREGDVLVMAATFAPDGKSVISQVFGDGGEWRLDSFDQISVWQTDLESGNFESSRIFQREGEFGGVSSRISRLENNSYWIRDTDLTSAILTNHFIVSP